MEVPVKFINLTDCTYLVLGSEGIIKEIPPSGLPVPKIKYDRQEEGVYDEIPTYTTKIKRIDNLPDPEQGVKYIVFPPIKRIARDLLKRDDCVSPVKVSASQGSIVTCGGFSS